MATETAAMPVNGNYGSHQSFGAVDVPSGAQPSAGNSVNGATGAQVPSTPASNGTSGPAEGNVGVPKDEVGWYFVEQYYTTLSQSPEKLHLFYNKRSQFVSGIEAEKVSVSVGQRAINERIKELDIQDCKVRVSNVDSQESFKNIVVQVIGEMSNKAAPHRKFVQTFVLAEQPNGYFVLNDIFRYISEDEEEQQLEEEAVPVGAPSSPKPLEDQPKTLTSSEDATAVEQDAQQVDRKLEEQFSGIATEDSTPEPPASNGISAHKAELEPIETEPNTAFEIIHEPEETPVDQIESIATVNETEKPKDPDPTPVASSPNPAKTSPAQVPTPAAPSKPAAPKTWANLVAANRAPPAVPTSSTSSVSQAPTQPKATAPVPAPIAAPTTPSVEDPSSQPLQSPGAGWQMAGQDNAKKQGRQQSNSGTGDKDNVLGYVKNVTERVDASLLKSALLSYGKLAYFDVSRAKNCAFVEFADTAGYNAAVAANPHLIGGEQIYVEERRPRPNAYGGGYNARGGMRGGRGTPDGGRPGSQGRGGFPKDGGRGGYIPRGRGGNMNPRGRSQPQTA